MSEPGELDAADISDEDMTAPAGWSPTEVDDDDPNARDNDAGGDDE